MKIYIYLLVIILSSMSCKSTISQMTENEKKIINNGSAETPFRVLLITNNEDSLFLREKCMDVNLKDINDNNFQLFIERLKTTLEYEEGVGLAAPQVGIGRNVFLFFRVTEPDLPVQVAINPRIVAHSENTVCFERDGCLSIPDISGNSIRYEWVEVEYYDEKGKQIKEKLSGYSRQTGFTGVIFQHEYDHLQGTLFIDKLCEEELHSSMLQLSSDMERKLYIDISDLAHQYKTTHLWEYLYANRTTAEDDFDLLTTLSANGVSACLKITTMCNLPDNMYPIDFLKQIVFTTEKGETITVEQKNDGNNNSIEWYLVLPVFEHEKATASIHKFCSLMIHMNNYIDREITN